MAEAGFTFRFQKLLDVKERQQRALELEMICATDALHEEERKLRRWRWTLDEVLDEIGAARCAGELVRAAQAEPYGDRVRREIAAGERAVADLHEQRQRLRKELERVMRGHKLLEGYRDRCKAQFLAEQEKAEERVIEMHAVRRFVGAGERR